VDHQLARKLHQLREQMIDKIRSAMDVQVYGAGKVTTPRRCQFTVHLNGAQQSAIKWSDADRQSVKVGMVEEIH